MVDVIVSDLPTKSTSQNLALSFFRQSETRNFEHALDGFSARVSIDLLEEYASGEHPAVSVYPDMVVQATLAESISQIGADQVWAMKDGSGNAVEGLGVVVAVIDTGIDYTHPDLGGGFGSTFKVMGGYDFFNHDSDPMDDNGHGTHVAGIISASGNLTGVAPKAKLLAYKALGSDGSGSMSQVIEGIEAAMDPNNDGSTTDHADVISMSLGGSGDSADPICTAVRNAVAEGIVVVVAAGNSGPGMGTVASPGIAQEAITVGAINETGALAPFSSRGVAGSLEIKPDISAPGVSILSTVPFDGTPHSSPTGQAVMSGTSMATPFVSGAAALLLQLHPTWSPAQVKSALISSATDIDQPLWLAGSGGLWIPSATQQRVFADKALVSYGFAGEPSEAISIRVTGTSLSLSSETTDEFSVAADGDDGVTYWSNVSSVSPSSINVPGGGSSAVTLSVAMPPADAVEGYYEGVIQLTGSSGAVRIPFGYALLSRLSVHVLDMNGQEVFDPYGGVWVYSLPIPDVAIGVRGNLVPAPPASFLLPSGDYSVHAAGHQLIYTYTDTYLLSATIHVGKVDAREITLRMSDARPMTLDLKTDDGNPIYVKDFRMYCRYASPTRNVSFHLVGSDYSVSGGALFTLPTSRTVYVNETMATVGISIAGFSYSAPMWDFMWRNWNHWYEFRSSTSTDFFIESSSDLQYLLAWEFQGIGSTTTNTLTLDESIASFYETKYDIPGALENVWGNWGTHLAIGGDSTFYMRRDTDTSLNPFFTGMTRTTIVQGVFSEPYFYANLFEGYFIRQMYSADYGHTVRADTISDIYLPDRNYLAPIQGISVTQRLGAGPYYPSILTENNDTSLVIYHPLLKDQSGADVGGMFVPSMKLYKNGGLVGIYQLSEYLARTNAKRIVDLKSQGAYSAEITYKPTPQICSDVEIVLNFTVPSADKNPPSIRSISMSQRFVPGSTIPIRVEAFDDFGIASVTFQWKTTSADAWESIPSVLLGPGVYEAGIPTYASTDSIDIGIVVLDSAGNSLSYTATAVSLKQIPVDFEIFADRTEFGYRDGEVSTVLTGTLVDSGGLPLYATAAVPLELRVGGKKVAMILDEYMGQNSHSHNGTIRFDWHLNPKYIFTGPNQAVDVEVTFDLGIYEKVTRTLTLSSIEFVNNPPNITLISPANNSLIRAGTPIQLLIQDDGAFTAQTYLDGALVGPLSAPFEVNTSKWTDGLHTLRIVVTDEVFVTVESSFVFRIDALDPYVSILYPTNGSRVPSGSKITCDVRDSNLDTVTFSVDGAPWQTISSPYVIDMSEWVFGNHTFAIQATDLVGRTSGTQITFELASTAIVIALTSPHQNDFIKPGQLIIFSIDCSGTFSCRWFGDGVWHDIGSQNFISTLGWSDGVHQILINATSDVGGSDEITVVVTVDSTVPVIQLVSPPANNSFVSPTDVIRFHVQETNLKSVNCTLWGITYGSSFSDISVSLAWNPGDGDFSVSVRATDKAGNEARSQFVFRLDSAEPHLDIVNIANGTVLKPGILLDVIAEDPYLTVVMWSLDVGDPAQLNAPYDIDTSLFSPGWHSIQLTARDESGKQSWCNTSFCVDSASPVIGSLSVTTFISGAALDIRASVTDDIGVRAVLVYYEREDGSYASMPMEFVNGSYVASLPADVLWDSMNVYVTGEDLAGNTATGVQVTLRESTPDLKPEHPGKLLSGVFEIALLGAFAVIISISLFYVSRRRRRNLETESKPTAPQTSIPEATRPQVADPVRFIRDLEVPAETNVSPTLAAPPIAFSAQPRDRGSVRQPTLIDSIPDIVVKSPAEDEPTADFGDLIEKELIIPSLKSSVYKDDIADLNAEIVRELDELIAMIHEKPKKNL